MPKQIPLAVQPPHALESVPTYRYWGATKPPKDYVGRKLVASIDGPRAAGGQLTNADETPVPDATSATIRMYGPIDSWGGYWGVSAADVSAALDSLPATVTSVQLRINSPGGEAWEGLAILNMLRAFRASVTAVVDGVAASAASFIAAGCDATVMSPGTQMMIHDASTFAYGKPADMESAKSFLESVSNSIAELYVEAAGGTVAGWRALMDPDTWYTATEAVAAGLADQVAVVKDAGVTTTADDDDPLEGLLSEEEIEAQFDLSIYAHAGRSNAPAPKPPAASADGFITTERGSAVALSDAATTTLRQKLGIAEDADEATLLAALDKALAERADPAPQATTPAVPEGMRLIEADKLAELQAGAADGVAARQTQRDKDRDDTIAAACRAGKITVARKEHWATAWDKDPEGVKATLEQLAPGLVDPTAEKGYDDDSESESPTSLADITSSVDYKNWSM